MGLQLIGLAKTRRAVRETGLDIVRLCRGDNHTWLAIVRCGDGHHHVRIDPRDWAVSWDRGCWASCAEGWWGPYVEVDGAEDGMPWWTRYAYVHEAES